MSEVTKPTEETPAPATTGGIDSETTPSALPTAPTTEPTTKPTTEPTAASTPINSTTDTTPAASKDKSTDEADTKGDDTPVGEGVLGYKSPGLIQSLLFSKRFFWFSDEPLNSDAVDSYLRTEKAEIAHSNAAWASETGKGLLLFAKRAEDKSAPIGIINLSGISDVSQDGSHDFSFKLNGHKHAFQASSNAERSTWIAAIEAKAAEAKASKEGLTSSESYKKHLDKYSKMGTGAAGTGAIRNNLSKSRERKDGAQRKSLETKAKETGKKDKSDASSSSSSDGEKKDKKAKSRSQSRKRNSIFGLLGKKEESEEKKDAKKEDRADETDEKKHDKDASNAEDIAVKEAPKEQPKLEADPVKEEKAVDATSSTPAGTGESATIPVGAVAPVAAPVTSPDDKAGSKTGETPTEASVPKSPESQDKDKKTAKRNSIFGMSFFGGKKDAISTEKPQGDGASATTAAKEKDVPPVSETAPKIEQPIQNKPIDTTAVTAPVDSAIAAHDVPAKEAPADPSSGPAAKGVSSPSSHKSNIMGFFRRQESKAEQKKEEKPEDPAMSPTGAADTSAVSESPVADTSDEKPTTDKRRRTSLFNNFGTIKEKKSTEHTSETEGTKGEGKKSPIPQKLGGLFRKPSKAVKPEESHTEPKSAGVEPATAEGVAAQPSASATGNATDTPSMAAEVKASA